jgi:hypothetical protein
MVPPGPLGWRSSLHQPGGLSEGGERMTAHLAFAGKVPITPKRDGPQR